MTVEAFLDVLYWTSLLTINGILLLVGGFKLIDWILERW